MGLIPVKTKLKEKKTQAKDAIVFMFLSELFITVFLVNNEIVLQ